VRRLASVEPRRAAAFLPSAISLSNFEGLGSRKSGSKLPHPPIPTCKSLHTCTLGGGRDSTLRFDFRNFYPGEGLF